VGVAHCTSGDRFRAISISRERLRQVLVWDSYFSFEASDYRLCAARWSVCQRVFSWVGRGGGQTALRDRVRLTTG
jgi:hypothetical protein